MFDAGEYLRANSNDALCASKAFSSSNMDQALEVSQLSLRPNILDSLQIKTEIK